MKKLESTLSYNAKLRETLRNIARVTPGFMASLQHVMWSKGTDLIDQKERLIGTDIVQDVDVQNLGKTIETFTEDLNKQHGNMRELETLVHKGIEQCKSAIQKDKRIIQQYHAHKIIRQDDISRRLYKIENHQTDIAKYENVAIELEKLASLYSKLQEESWLSWILRRLLEFINAQLEGKHYVSLL